MGFSNARARNSLRFSLGPATTAERSRLRRRRRCRASWPSSAALGRTASAVALDMRVVVAMSGGVDSSVAASLLAEAGHDVVGLSMQLYDQRDPRESVRVVLQPRRSCTTRGASPPRSAFPHYIVNFEEQFQATVVRQLRERIRRRAHADPLRALQRRPEVRDARRARGRVRRRRRRHRPLRARRVRRRDRGATGCCAGVDRDKDQSYFLFSLTQDQLAHALFPVGHLTKPEVRAHAAAARPARRRQAGQPRDLLRARRRRRRLRRAAPGRRATHAGEIVDSGGRVARPAPRPPPADRRPAQGPWPLDRRADVRAAARAGRERASSSARAKSSAGASSRRRRSTGSAATPPASPRPRHRPHPPPPRRRAGDGHARRRRPRARRRSTSRRWRSRPARRSCSTTERRCWAAAGLTDRSKSHASTRRSRGGTSHGDKSVNPCSPVSASVSPCHVASS